MSESVIFNHPLIFLCYLLAFGIMIFDGKRRETKGILPLISAVIVILTSAYALLHGATAFETASVIGIFLIPNLLQIGGEET